MFLVRLYSNVLADSKFRDQLQNFLFILFRNRRRLVFRLFIKGYKLIYLCIFFIKTGHLYGRYHVVDDYSIPPPLGLEPLSDIIHKVRINIRNVLHQYIRGAIFRQSYLFTRSPLQGAMFAKVDNRIYFKLMLQPEIEGKILVVGRQRYIMVKMV